MTMRYAALVFLPLLLAGCASDPQAQIEADKAQCRGYGMKPGTEAFANCRMTLDVERQRERQRAFDDFAYRDRAFGPYFGPSYIVVRPRRHR